MCCDEGRSEEWARGEGRREKGEWAKGEWENGRVGDWESENGRDWTCNMLVVQQEKESPCGPPFEGKGGQQTRRKRGRRAVVLPGWV